MVGSEGSRGAGGWAVRVWRVGSEGVEGGSEDVLV